MKAKKIDGKEYPNCSTSKGLPPKQVSFGGVARKKYNNLVVADEEERDEEEVVDDEIFFNSEDEEGMSDFDNIENIEEEE